jgi:ABC-type dipeptide/oligopeptide/nickel transport system permease subunit
MRKKLRDPLVWFGIVFMVLLILFAIFGPMIPIEKGDPVFDDASKGISPHLGPGKSSFAPLGTDDLGRSFLQRLAYGARISLLVGLIVQVVNIVVGITMGAIGAFGPKWLRIPVLRFTDGMFAFPDILLAVMIIGIMKPGIVPVIVALCVTGWPSIARMSRNQLVTLKEREFVVAAKASGASTFYLVVRHMLPQMTGILLAISMVDLAGTILAESTLSFLGIGVQSPDPSWGSMVNNARQNMNSYAIELVWPCVILSLTVFSLNFIGDGLRAYFDPKSNNI